tara:strand:- start:1105 stop:2280 length:1176 start_codon:yes stop_codon:yes gene_type:complete
VEKNNLELGKKIKRFRLINDIRQEDMAEKLQVSRATLINYEKGHTAISVDLLNRLTVSYPDFELDDKANSKPNIITDGIIDFKVVFNILSKKKSYILITTFLFTFLGGSSSFLFKKYYRAEISLYPAKNELNQGFGQFQSLVANFGMNSNSNDQNFNIPDVVKSRLIAEKAINQEWVMISGKNIRLIDLWSLNKASKISIRNKLAIDSLIIKEKAIRKFHDHIDVSENKLSGLIKISSTFQDPIISATIANFIGEQVERYIQKENSAQSKKEKIFISERLSIVKNELDFEETKLKNFKKRNRGYEDSPELSMISSRLEREVEAKKGVYLTLQQQLELARIEEVKKSPILHVLDYASIPIDKSSPKRITFVIISSLIGFIFSCLRSLSINED